MISTLVEVAKLERRCPTVTECAGKSCAVFLKLGGCFMR